MICVLYAGLHIIGMHVNQLSINMHLHIKVGQPRGGGLRGWGVLQCHSRCVLLSLSLTLSVYLPMFNSNKIN